MNAHIYACMHCDKLLIQLISLFPAFVACGNRDVCFYVMDGHSHSTRNVQPVRGIYLSMVAPDGLEGRPCCSQIAALRWQAMVTVL